MRRGALLILLAMAMVSLLPGDALAWSPGTHVYLGQAVLAHLGTLPAHVAQVLSAFPVDFLYGSIAADTSFAKKYAPVGRHSHSWHVGQEILELAASRRLEAFGFGYLAHLAADVVAHNHYVPRQLVVTSSTEALGHSYWEARFDLRVGERYARQAVDVIRQDHSANDAHLDRIISPTIFSVRTNRRLFRGMVTLGDLDSWTRIVQVASRRSRWELSNPVVERHMAMSFDYVMDVLAGGPEAVARRHDPSGADALGAAKRMRRHVLARERRPDPEQLTDTAEDHFGLPAGGLGYWERLETERPWTGN